MVVDQPERLPVQGVEMRRLQNRIPVAGEIAITLVVGNHDHYVGLAGRNGMNGEGEEEQRELGGDFVQELHDGKTRSQGHDWSTNYRLSLQTHSHHFVYFVYTT